MNQTNVLSSSSSSSIRLSNSDILTNNIIAIGEGKNSYNIHWGTSPKSTTPIIDRKVEHSEISSKLIDKFGDHLITKNKLPGTLKDYFSVEVLEKLENNQDLSGKEAASIELFFKKTTEIKSTVIGFYHINVLNKKFIFPEKNYFNGIELYAMGDSAISENYVEGKGAAFNLMFGEKGCLAQQCLNLEQHERLGNLFSEGNWKNFIQTFKEYLKKIAIQVIAFDGAEVIPLCNLKETDLPKYTPSTKYFNSQKNLNFYGEQQNKIFEELLESKGVKREYLSERSLALLGQLTQENPDPLWLTDCIEIECDINNIINKINYFIKTRQSSLKYINPACLNTTSNESLSILSNALKDGGYFNIFGTKQTIESESEAVYKNRLDIFSPYLDRSYSFELSKLSQKSDKNFCNDDINTLEVLLLEAFLTSHFLIALKEHRFDKELAENLDLPFSEFSESEPPPPAPPRPEVKDTTVRIIINKNGKKVILNQTDTKEEISYFNLMDELNSRFNNLKRVPLESVKKDESSENTSFFNTELVKKFKTSNLNTESNDKDSEDDDWEDDKQLENLREQENNKRESNIEKTLVDSNKKVESKILIFDILKQDDKLF